MEINEVAALIFETAKHAYERGRENEAPRIAGLEQQVDALVKQREDILGLRDQSENDLNRAFEAAGLTSGTVDQLVKRIKEIASGEKLSDGLLEVLQCDFAKLAEALATNKRDEMLQRIKEYQEDQCRALNEVSNLRSVLERIAIALGQSNYEEMLTEIARLQLAEPGPKHVLNDALVSNLCDSLGCQQGYLKAKVIDLVYWYDGHDHALQAAKRKARECPPPS